VVRIRVRAVLAAGASASDLTLQALDQTVLLLQLFAQPGRRRRRRRRGGIRSYVGHFVAQRMQQLDLIIPSSRSMRIITQHPKKKRQKTKDFPEDSQLSAETHSWKTWKREFTANVTLSVGIKPAHRSSCSLVHSASVRLCRTRKPTCRCSSSLSPSSSRRRASISCWILAGPSGGPLTLSSQGSGGCDPCRGSPRLAQQ